MMPTMSICFRWRKSTPISFLKAAMGNIDLGDVIVKGVDFNARIDSQGQLNFLQAIKPSNTRRRAISHPNCRTLRGRFISSM